MVKSPEVSYLLQKTALSRARDGGRGCWKEPPNTENTWG